jgi:hypothetical protein
MKKLAALAAVVASACAAGASSPTSPATTTTTTGTSSGTLPAIYAKFGNGTTVTLDGSTVVLRTKDLPNHVSPYWGPGHAMYEAPHAGMFVNPHLIGEQNLTLRVPASPAIAGQQDTPLGAIGIATNGVVFFNQYAAGRQPLTSEILSFDRMNGHPAPGNTYHYHFEPLWLTSSSPSALIGVLLDGFAVYGPQDMNGQRPTDLDSCNGHTAVTSDFSTPTYHYHTTTQVPYIAGCFRGTPGSAG